MVLLDLGSRISLLSNNSGIWYRTMKLLTGCAVAVLGVQGLLPTQLVLDLATMTAGFIASVKIWIIVMNLVRRSEFPLVVFPFSTSLVAIVTV